MNQLFKKGTAFTLTLVLLLSLLPLSALAADGDPCTVMADCTGTYENGLCNVCGQPAPADEPPTDEDGGDASPTPPHTHVYDGTPTYAPKDDAFHTVTRPCTTCAEQPTETLDEGHTYVDGVCACGKEGPTHTHVYDGTPTYAPKDDSVHTVTRPCTSCQEKPTQTIDEPHTYTDGLCPCGKEEPSTDDVGDGSSVPPAPVDEALEAVKTQLEALPTLEELSAMTRDEKIALHDTAYLTAGNAYNALTEEQKAQVDATKLMALGEYFADPGNLQTLETEPVTSGTTGDCTWSYADGTLTITGPGNMGSSSPWVNYQNEIQRVIIEDGVTSIGNYAFRGYTSLTTVTIPGSVTSIGSNAFYKCTSLTTVKYGGNHGTTHSK